MRPKSRLFHLIVVLSILAFVESIPGDPLDIWTVRSPRPPGESLYAVTCASGQFVAVGDRNPILSSTDGVSWGQRLGTNNLGNLWPTGFGAVAYGNGQFVATGVIPFDGPIESISTDGTNWIEVLGGPGGSAPGGPGVSYANGLFVAAINDMTSTDATNWALATSNHAGSGRWTDRLAK